MRKADAVNTLMREWGAGEQFRPFFERCVERYMGEGRNVLVNDLQGIRDYIDTFAKNNF